MHPSGTIYTTFVLSVYDAFVLWFSNNFVWLCPTTDILLPFFRHHVGTGAHMDVGVGTGYYTAESVRELAKTETVCLVDINPTTLGMASGRLEEAGYEGEVETVQQDVFKPLPAELHGRFDAVSMFFLLHCLPGAFPEKADKVVANLVPALTANGTLYGATILGRGVRHNAMGRFLMRSYNQRRIFGNEEDSKEGLEEALERWFEEVEVKVCGTVALFAARRPLRNHAQHDASRS